MRQKKYNKNLLLTIPNQLVFSLNNEAPPQCSYTPRTTQSILYFIDYFIIHNLYQQHLL